MKSKWVVLLCILVAGAFGCQLDEDIVDAGGGSGGGSTGGAAETDSGSGGEPSGQGGNASGGSGGVATGGMGGTAGAGGAGGQEGPCATLDAGPCQARDDCVARWDLDGNFASCVDLADAPCVALDLDGCDARDDCIWDDDACHLRPVACEEHPDPATCGAANCHWYEDACHTEAQPNRCDQPDPIACEDAGCQWTPLGCRAPLLPCGELTEAACEQRDDCELRGNTCVVDTGDLSCNALEMFDCMERNECVWGDEGCVDRPEGPCVELGPDACDARVDCEPIWEDSDDCACGGADAMPCREGDPNCDGVEEPEPPCDCEPMFAGCMPARVECGNVPIDACDATPGCHVDEIALPCDCGCGWDDEGEDANGDGLIDCEDCGCPDPGLVCVPDGPAACEDLMPDACDAAPHCRVVEREICDEPGWDDAGAREPGAPDLPDADRVAPQPCRVEYFCEPRRPQMDCFELHPNECERHAECVLDVEVVCMGEGEGEAFPDDPDGRPAPPLPPEECFEEWICRPRGDLPERCGDIRDGNRCLNMPGCEWMREPDCDCNDGPVPVPGPCDCDGDDCMCDPMPVPPPPCEGCFVCVDADWPRECWDLPFERCLDRPDCRWVDGPMEPPDEPCGCWIDENGNEICECGGAAPGPIPAGFCEPWRDDPRDPCRELDPDACQGHRDCILIEGDANCDCDFAGDPPENPDENPGGVVCPPCAVPLLCLSLDEYCSELWDEACSADPLCMVVEIGICAEPEPMPCPPGEDCPDFMPPRPACDVVTECQPMPNRCVGLNLEACEASDLCVPLFEDAGEDYLGCWLADECWGLERMACEAHPSCRLEQVDFDGDGCGCEIDEAGNEVCWCGDPMPDFECVPDGDLPECRAHADCAPFERCVNGACVEDRCWGAWLDENDQCRAPNDGMLPDDCCGDIGNQGECFVTGCSSEICASDPNIGSACIWLEWFACFEGASCERQNDGRCGWSMDDELLACFEENGGPVDVDRP